MMALEDLDSEHDDSGDECPREEELELRSVEEQLIPLVNMTFTYYLDDYADEHGCDCGSLEGGSLFRDTEVVPTYIVQDAPQYE